MRKQALLILVCFLELALAGCSSERPLLGSTEGTSGLIWRTSDFKKTDARLDDEATTKINMQGIGRVTPFHGKDKTPSWAVYTYYNKESKSLVDLAWDFGEFKNIFLYEDEDRLTIAGGARSFSKSGRLVAEARLLRFLEPDRKPERFEIEEFHYGPEGNLIFMCKSQFDDLGIKIGQREEQGTKKEEYYFTWAVGF